MKREKRIWNLDRTCCRGKIVQVQVRLIFSKFSNDLTVFSFLYPPRIYPLSGVTSNGVTSGVTRLRFRRKTEVTKNLEDPIDQMNWLRHLQELGSYL